MPKFIALPVGQGDAFYLDRGDWSVLVDGGRSRCKFPTMIQPIVGSNTVDVIVCTHNDADHANGILGFLESELKCREVWLPGRWLETLPAVLRPFIEVVTQIGKEVAEVVNEGLTTDDPQGDPRIRSMSLAELADRMLDEEKDREEGTDLEALADLQEDGWPHDLVGCFEEGRGGGERSWPSSCYLGKCIHALYRRVQDLRLDPGGRGLLWSAIHAAQRIRAIAIAAFHRGLAVRWFEYDLVHPGGRCSQLLPLNSREIVRVRQLRGPLLHRQAGPDGVQQGEPGILVTSCEVPRRRPLQR